jgi:tetratricopeptide (TPR) repeat protein
MAALIANHMELGEETREAARWSARAAYWAGSSRPGDALRLWRKTMELAERLGEDEESTGLAVMSRLLQLDFAWRLGMDSTEEARLAAEAEELAERSGDLRSLALLRMVTAVRPGMEHRAEVWLGAVADTVRLADESEDLHLRVAVRAAGSYAYLCSGRFDDFEASLREVLELVGEDRGTGAGIIIGSPIAWATMALGMVWRERGRLDDAEAQLEAGLRLADEAGDPEIASWTRSTQALMLAMRGEAEAGVALARRNCELTERLGDVFSRSLALANLGASQLAAGEYAGALDSLEEAERIYRAAMDNGGEMEAWRAALRADALTGVGRAEEAIELAEWAAGIAEERGMRWSLPLALLAAGRARVAAGHEGVREVLDRAAAIAEETGAAATLTVIEDERGALSPTR